MNEDVDQVDHPLADGRIRSLVGLLSGLMVAVISVLFLEGIALWVGLGVAVMEVLVLPYFLGKAVEGAAEQPATEEAVE